MVSRPRPKVIAAMRPLGMGSTRIDMQIWDKTEIAELLIEAGRIALYYYRNPQSSIKEDGSVVTIADVEIERFFRKVFE